MKRLTVLAIVFILLFSIIVIANGEEENFNEEDIGNEEETEEGLELEAEEETEEAGVTPDSFLWGLDRALERMDLLLTFDRANKAKKGLRHAQERLLEVREMVERNKLKHIEKVEKAHERSLEKVKTHLRNLKEKNVETEIEKEIEIEEKLKIHEKKFKEFKTDINIRIKGTLTEEQQGKLQAFLDSLEGNVNELKVQIKIKKDETKIKIREYTGKSKEEVEAQIEKLEEKRGVENYVEEYIWTCEEIKFEIEYGGETLEIDLALIKEETDIRQITNKIKDLPISGKKKGEMKEEFWEKVHQFCKLEPASENGEEPASENGEEPGKSQVQEGKKGN